MYRNAAAPALWWNQHGHLAAIHHCLKGCPQSHLGFAVANITTEQASIGRGVSISRFISTSA